MTITDTFYVKINLTYYFLSQSSGGNIISMYTDEDVRLVNELRWKESLVRPTAVPALWTIKRHVLGKVRDAFEAPL